MNFRNFLFWLTALTSLALDRLTKIWVVQTFELTVPADTWPLWRNVFHFTYVINTGAAFSLFQGVDWLRWLSLLVCLVLVGVGLFNSQLLVWEQAGYGFLLGGAAGNGIDRWVTGHVVDFLDFRLIQFPVFNVADIAINLGLACLLFSAWRHGSHRKDNAPSP
ncbi:MAG: signal peptidase II [Cyanobacteria bacterium P01_A01_bin.17]